MMNFNQPQDNNPLSGFMRQPKIYIKLPSGGAFWPRSSIDIPETGDLAVYSMTAKDEITFKTPDALLNGQAVVDVIHSCIPSIKDAWKCPNIDLDTILIAIRLASYGEMMDVTHTVPGTTEQVTHNVDLRLLLDQLSSAGVWQEMVELDTDLTCFVRPITYKDITQSSLRTFESQRRMQSVTDESVTEEQKIEILNQTFDNIADINFDLVINSVVAIQTADAVVEDPQFIREFLQNADKSMFDKIQSHLTQLQKSNTLKPLRFQSTDEQIAEGAPAEYELPIRMDNADFFVLRS
jgi:hypothetical protein